MRLERKNAEMKDLASYSKRTFLVMIVMLGIALYCSTATAQSGAGSIQGTVTDSTGAVIPGASIHVVNQGTGIAADTKSNAVGFYEFPISSRALTWLPSLRPA